MAVDPRTKSLAWIQKYARRQLWERDGQTCGICGQPLAFEDMALDHVKPKSLGGADHWDNLRATHRACNVRRGNGHVKSSQPPRRYLLGVWLEADEVSVRQEGRAAAVRAGIPFRVWLLAAIREKVAREQEGTAEAR